MQYCGDGGHGKGPLNPDVYLTWILPSRPHLHLNTLFLQPLPPILLSDLITALRCAILYRI
jgi:hypothetical protein